MVAEIALYISAQLYYRSSLSTIAACGVAHIQILCDLKCSRPFFSTSATSHRPKTRDLDNTVNL